MMSYGQTVYANNAQSALRQVAALALRDGADVSPRGLLTKELRHATIVVYDPTNWSCGGINADWSARVVVTEVLQLVGGFSDPDRAVALVPSLAPFRNEAGQFDGAYGPRAREALRGAVKRLREDPDSRQAVVTIYQGADTLLEGSKDYPCTLTLQFLIRSGRLDLDVTMRSNDIDWGFKHDMGQFMILQCSVANLLGMRPGHYVHTAHSLHLYERSFEWAENLIPPKVLGSPPYMQGGLNVHEGDTVLQLQSRAKAIWDDQLSYEPNEPNDLEVWMREVLNS